MIRMTLAALAVMTPVAASAHDGMAVRDAYVRSTNPKIAAAFMVLENHRQVECRLTGASTPAAERAELHTHAEENGVMTMRPVEGGIAVAAGGEHALARGGDHVMMLGLDQPLAEGGTVALTLDFGDCGTLEVEAVVDNARAPGPAAGHGMHKGH